MFMINPPAILQTPAPLVQQELAVRPDVLSLIDHAHAAATDGGEDFIGTQATAGLDRHTLPRFWSGQSIPPGSSELIAFLLRNAGKQRCHSQRNNHRLDRFIPGFKIHDLRAQVSRSA
jgi:hypothetical protein